jgi:hypothetical protein
MHKIRFGILGSTGTLEVILFYLLFNNLFLLNCLKKITKSDKKSTNEIKKLRNDYSVAIFVMKF